MVFATYQRMRAKVASWDVPSQVAFRPIYELCTRVEQITGYIRMMRWWYQDVGREE